jgi:hypothetical protein
MKAYQFLDQCESNPGALVGPTAHTLDAMETLEYSGPLFIWNTQTCIFNL